MEIKKFEDFYFGLKSGRDLGFIDYYKLKSYDAKDNVVKYIVYDANMMPHSNFETWSDNAKSEVIQFVRNHFSGFIGSIFIDNQEIVFRGDKNA